VAEQVAEIDRMTREIERLRARIATERRMWGEATLEVERLQSIVDAFMSATEWVGDPLPRGGEDLEAYARIREVRAKVKGGE